MNNVVFRKTEMLNLYIGKEKKLFSIRTKLLYYKIFHRKFVTIKMRKTQVLMNKPVYFSLSVLDLSKTVMDEFWYDYVKPKYDENAKLCYMDIDSFHVHTKTDDIYKDIAEDGEARFDTQTLN